ncbi:hypothetical protein LLH06_00815 [Mucilaginibacter daejeonensis]|uniref:hypothetical protein n=1 Tax=Mucilaginibacter daejeonensis TaxID=398049 RepID=UPI001D1741C5|nr:hypothetical protein [Mucilaginibacter daejeonensis]UEG53517.1 hypothetical protein LLH06_00815 [Mucilaginibacter daejeonensis]
MRYRILMIPALALLSACGEPSDRSDRDKDTTIVKTEATTVEPTKAEVAADHLIVPGKSIGQTRLDEDMDQVIARLGKPDGGDAAMGKSTSVWYTGHDTAKASTTIFASRQMGTADERARVKQIRVTSPWFKTADGIMTGADKAAIEKIYPHLEKAESPIAKDEVYADKAAGIAFEFDGQDKCSAIIVMLPEGKN